MYDLDVKTLNRGLVNAVKLVVAVRRMVKPGRGEYLELRELEREIRAAAAECQRVLHLVECDGARPLIIG